MATASGRGGAQRGRREWFVRATAVGAACAAGLLVSVVSASRLAAAPARPNVVLIISDDQGFTDYGFMGHPAIRTPNLDRLASQSAVYRRGYVPTALCRPSLATIITGRYAHQHKISGNDPADRTPENRERVISQIDRVATIPRVLGQAGYVSLQTGKWWEGSYRRGGFTEGMTRGFPEPGGRHGDDGLKIGREGMGPIFSFIGRAAEQKRPFFVWYAPFMPHTPHTPPQTLLAKYRAPGRPEALAKYYAMCEWFDQTCGQLLEYLDRSGLRENTLVLYVCDNGWITRTPESPTPEGWRTGFAPRSKQSPFEMGVRTPIMVSWPGRVRPKLDDVTLVSSIDLAPTIYAACGAAPPPGLPGRSLLDDAAGRRPLERDAVFGEAFAHDIADIERPVASLQYRWCVDGWWKLILNYRGKLGRYEAVHAWDREPIRLYDLSDDPFERRNLAPERPEVARRLRERIEQWWPLPADAPPLQ